MKLSEVMPHVLGLLAANDAVSAVPRIEQTDSEYNSKLETALRDTGVAVVSWLGGGAPFDSNALHEIQLDNHVILTVVENPQSNQTGKTAAEWSALIIGALHHAGHPQSRGPRAIRFDDPAYEIGPLNTAQSIYFINLLVRSTDPLVPAS